MRRAASLGALAFVGIIILISGGRRSFDNPHGTASSLSVEENQYYARSTALTFEPEPTDRQHQCVTIVALQHGGGADGVDMEAAAAATARSLFGSSAKEIQLLFMGQSGSIEQVLLASSVPMPQPDLVRTLQEIPMWDPFTVADSAIDMSTCFLYSVVHVGDSFTSTLHEQAAWVMRARHRVAAVSTFHLGKDGAPISWNPFDETAQAAPDGSASLLQRYWPVDRREVRALSRLSPGAVFSTAALKQARVSPLHSLRAACGADVALVSTWLHWSVHRIGYTAWTISEYLYSVHPDARYQPSDCAGATLQSDPTRAIRPLSAVAWAEAPLATPAFWRMKRLPLPHRIDFEGAFGGRASSVVLESSAMTDAEDDMLRGLVDAPLIVAWREQPGPVGWTGKAAPPAAAEFAVPSHAPMLDDVISASQLVPKQLLGELMCYLLRTRLTDDGAVPALISRNEPSAALLLPYVRSRSCVDAPVPLVEWIDECGARCVIPAIAASRGMHAMYDAQISFSPAAAFLSAGQVASSTRLLHYPLPPHDENEHNNEEKTAEGFHVVVVVQPGGADLGVLVVRRMESMLDAVPWTADVRVPDASSLDILRASSRELVEWSAAGKLTASCEPVDEAALRGADAVIVLLEPDRLDSDPTALRLALASDAVVVTVDTELAQHYLCRGCGMVVSVDDHVATRGAFARLLAHRLVGSLQRLATQEKLRSSIREAAREFAAGLTMAAVGEKVKDAIGDARRHAEGLSEEAYGFMNSTGVRDAAREMQRMAASFVWV